MQQVDYQRRWMADRRSSFMQHQSCCDCGSTFDLQLHHLDRTKKISHSIWSWSEKRRTEELKKCVVVCGRCHRIRTRAQRYNLIHGTRNGYAGYGCRCPECTRGARDYQREWRGRKNFIMNPGVEKQSSRQAHNLETAGANPAPGTIPPSGG